MKMNSLQKIWNDDDGAVVTVDVLIWVTIVGIGSMTAWVMVRNAVLAKIEEQAAWIAGEEPDCTGLVVLDGNEGNNLLVCADMDGG